MKVWEVLDSIIGKYISMKRDEMKSRNNEKCAADVLLICQNLTSVLKRLRIKI